MNKFLRLWLLPILWASVIFFFSSLQTNALGGRFIWYDFLIKKSAHIFEFALLSILIFRALTQTYHHSSFASNAKTTFFISLLYAISDEFHQRFTYGRTSRLRDIVIDTLGILLALYLINKLKKLEKLKMIKKFIFGEK
jgi:VanZ family protein